MKKLNINKTNLATYGVVIVGFAVMQTFMDDLSVSSAPGEGTKVVMIKSFRCLPEAALNL